MLYFHSREKINKLEKQKKKYDKLTRDKKNRTDEEKNKLIEDAKVKREDQLRKARLSKNKELPDFKDDDFVPTITKTSATGGLIKKNPKAELYEKLKDIIDDPKKLEMYKRKNYKGLNDTSEIDGLIHRAKVKQNKVKTQRAEQESENFDQALKLQIQRARKFLIKERQKGSIKAKSMRNATMLNWSKTIESFLCVYPVEPDRRANLLNNIDELGRTPLFYSWYHGNYDSMSLLLAAGADACIADKNFCTPLHYVSK